MANNGRRDFLKQTLSAIAIGASTPSLLATNKNRGRKRYPIPPGAVSLQRFKSKCTACQLCVEHCPSGVLTPSTFENGFTGMMQPVLKFDVEKFCEYECARCSDICPNNALIKLSVEEKKVTQIGIADLVFAHCIVKTKHEDCGACAEHCPTAAIKMLPWNNGLTRPKVTNPEVCIGCGGCESICPEAGKAMTVYRNEIHQKAEPPIIEKQDNVSIDGFGF